MSTEFHKKKKKHHDDYHYKGELEREHWPKKKKKTPNKSNRFLAALMLGPLIISKQVLPYATFDAMH